VPWGVVFPSEAAQLCPGVEGLCARHPSQLYEAGLEGFCLGLLLLILAFRGALRFPGLLTGVFFVGYALARFSVEFFRQAEAQFITLMNPNGYVIQYNDFGITMGQALSLPMVFIGLAIIFLSLNQRFLSHNS
jgi:phosphatidylglycerol:prolipoprotein diacylglycerol transferase